MRAHAWGRALAWAAVTAMAVAASPGVDALDPTLAGLGDALALGLLAGAAAFGLVARRRLAVSDVIALPPRRLVARSLVLTAKSAQEEVLWRALLLGLPSPQPTSGGRAGLRRRTWSREPRSAPRTSSRADCGRRSRHTQPST